MRAYSLWLTAILVLLIVPVVAQQSQPNPKPLPLNPEVTYGKLNNGLTYYIKQNPKPEGRAFLMLAIKAGSVLETDAQQGLAHLTEHMLFNGTKNFKKQELVNFFEAAGMRMGNDLNAFTSFDQTVYMLEVPVGKTDVFNKSFQVLEDWAHNASFEGEEIDKERKVVIEEWRLGKGPDERMRNKSFPVLFHNSRYADRLPIGKIDILKNFKHNVLTDYYKKWYRPELMAVIAIGDFDAKEVEQKIKQHMGAIAPSTQPAEVPTYDVPAHPEKTLVTVASDPEASYARASIYFKHPAGKLTTTNQLKYWLSEQMAMAMLNSRLAEMKNAPTPPFYAAYAGKSGFVKPIEFFSATAICTPQNIATAFEAITTELIRANQNGFAQSELDRAQKDMLSMLESRAKEKNKTESKQIAFGLMSHFLTGDAETGDTYLYNFAQKHLPTTTVEQCHQALTKLITEHNNVLVIEAPEKEGITLPNQNELKDLWAKVWNSKPQPYQAQLTPEQMLSQMPKPGKVTKTEALKSIDATKLTLSNGATVILKTTDFKNDEIVFNAFSQGGGSLVTDPEWQQLRFAPRIVASAGAGQLDENNLTRYMAGKNVYAFPYISNFEEGMRGAATVKDFEMLLELIYAYMAEPHKDKEAFTSIIQRQKMAYENYLKDPTKYFYNEAVKTLNNKSNRAEAVPTAAELDGIELEKVYNLYKNRFDNAADFTFVFGGNINPQQHIPLIEKYIGGLPSKPQQTETYKQISDLKYPEKDIDKIIKKGQEDKSIVYMNFVGNFDYTNQNRYALSLLTAALNENLSDVLREDEGGVYTVSVRGLPEKIPTERYRISIQFGCEPKRREELIKLVMKEIDKMKKDGPSKELLSKVTEQQLAAFDKEQKENAYWVSYIKTTMANNLDLNRINNYAENIKSITPKDLKKAAKIWFNQDRLIKMSLVPEKVTTQE